MAKVKVLADRISISSDILTDENLKKVSVLAPSLKTLRDEFDESKVVFEICNSECNTFTNYGAGFKDGKSLAIVDERVMSLSKEEREKEIKNLISGVLLKINSIEEQIEAYMEEAPDFEEDIEFLD